MVLTSGSLLDKSLGRKAILGKGTSLSIKTGPEAGMMYSGTWVALVLRVQEKMRLGEPRVRSWSTVSYRLRSFGLTVKTQSTLFLCVKEYHN